VTQVLLAHPLAVEHVIELSFLMDVAVVDMHGGKK
jgi:hypothetical protein